MHQVRRRSIFRATSGVVSISFIGGTACSSAEGDDERDEDERDENERDENERDEDERDEA